jgi:hypothetical protein
MGRGVSPLESELFVRVRLTLDLLSGFLSSDRRDLDRRALVIGSLPLEHIPFKMPSAHWAFTRGRTN